MFIINLSSEYPSACSDAGGKGRMEKITRNNVSLVFDQFLLLARRFSCRRIRLYKPLCYRSNYAIRYCSITRCVVRVDVYARPEGLRKQTRSQSHDQFICWLTLLECGGAWNFMNWNKKEVASKCHIPSAIGFIEPKVGILFSFWRTMPPRFLIARAAICFVQSVR